jgi:hypothetical protein
MVRNLDRAPFTDMTGRVRWFTKPLSPSFLATKLYKYDESREFVGPRIVWTVVKLPLHKRIKPAHLRWFSTSRLDKVEDITLEEDETEWGTGERTCVDEDSDDEETDMGKIKGIRGDSSSANSILVGNEALSRGDICSTKKRLKTKSSGHEAGSTETI